MELNPGRTGAHPGYVSRENKGTPHVPTANRTARTPIILTPSPAFTCSNKQTKHRFWLVMLIITVLLIIPVFVPLDWPCPQCWCVHMRTRWHWAGWILEAGRRRMCTRWWGSGHTAGWHGWPLPEERRFTQTQTSALNIEIIIMSLVTKGSQNNAWIGFWCNGIFYP